MEPEMYSEGFRLPVEKHRCFSTSTPFMGKHMGGKGRLLLTEELCDSGLGSSISESVIAEKSSFEQTSVSTYPSSTSKSASKFTVRTAEVTITHSPIFPENGSINVMNNNESLNISNISFSKSRRLFRRKLNLDIDIGEEVRFQTQNETKSEDRLELININLNNEIQTPVSSMQTCSTVCTPSAASVIEQKIIDMDKLLGTYSPVEADRLIGRKMGRSHVDIMLELHSRNISCVSDILSFLEPEDLCSMCMVNKSWQTVCEVDNRANQRRQKFIKQCKRNRRDMCKENAVKKTARPLRPLTTVLQTLATVQPTGLAPSRLKPERCRTPTEQFIEAAKALKNDEKLHKCPRCRKPATVPPVQDRGKCQNSECGFDYCIRCLGDFHGAKPCAPIGSKKTKVDAIGTKKSKKNLKRL